VRRDGDVARVRIAWGGEYNPISRGTLGLDLKGDVVFFEWTTVTPLTLTHNDDGKVSTISLLQQKFRRNK